MKYINTSKRPLYQHILPRLEKLKRQKKTITYGALAKRFDSAAQAVGQALAALGRRGHHDVCALVVFKH